MNAVLVRGQVNQFRGTMKARWCGLTGNRLGRAHGRMLRLLGRTQILCGRTLGRTKKRFRKLVG